MKRVYFILGFFIVSITNTLSQDVGGKTLISQSRTTIANIGKCDITIKYHSPSVNGRKVFGGIVPFDFVINGKEYPWRAGANQRTIIEFSHDVAIEGKSLPRGSYGFLVLVSKEEWTLIFSNGKSWGPFQYDPANDVLRVPVKVETAPYQEWLSYEFLNPLSESADIELRWENNRVSFNVSTDAMGNLREDISKKETKGPNDYLNLAIVKREKEPDQIDKVIELIDKSLEVNNIENEARRQAHDFSANMMKADLLIENGEKKAGEKLKKETMKTASGFNIYYYALKKYSVEGKKNEAFKILKEAVKANPDNFQNHLALGEYYLYEKNQVKATEHFRIAYEMTLKQESNWLRYAEYLYLQNKLVLENL